MLGLKIVQQGSVGVIKRLGEFKAVRQPGITFLVPFVDRMVKVDMREFPQTGDKQFVITADNVSLQVSATIFCQVIDVKAALFEINDFQLAVDQLSLTALRAVFGEMTLDQSLSQRETINARMQDHMADATMKWGVRLNRIEILDITPPNNVLQAMSEQKEAEQHKRAAILKSEGDQQSAINSAQGRKQAAVLEAEGQKQAVILGAEAQMKALELQAEGEKKARSLRGQGEAEALSAIDRVEINPNTLAVLQLRARFRMSRRRRTPKWSSRTRLLGSSVPPRCWSMPSRVSPLPRPLRHNSPMVSPAHHRESTPEGRAEPFTWPLPPRGQ